MPGCVRVFPLRLCICVLLPLGVCVHVCACACVLGRGSVFGEGEWGARSEHLSPG